MSVSGPLGSLRGGLGARNHVALKVPKYDAKGLVDT